MATTQRPYTLKYILIEFWDLYDSPDKYFKCDRLYNLFWEVDSQLYFSILKEINIFTKSDCDMEAVCFTGFRPQLHFNDFNVLTIFKNFNLVYTCTNVCWLSVGLWHAFSVKPWNNIVDLAINIINQPINKISSW